MITSSRIGFLLLFVSFVGGQRVAPGVPPQQYQQVPSYQQHHAPPPPQYQQVPAQGAQVQYQQQQVPVQPHGYQQQQYQQQQHQQQPPQAHHPHGHNQGVLNADITHEREHIAEHLDVPIDTSKMTDQELQFHYFKMHDSDNNNKLDGCELIKSLIHWHDDNDGSKHGSSTGDVNTQNQNNNDQNDDVHKDDTGNAEKKTEEAEPRSDESLEKLIDPILDIMDKDRDGFISYPEYRVAEQLDV